MLPDIVECLPAALGLSSNSSFNTVMAYAPFPFISSLPDCGMSFLTSKSNHNRVHYMHVPFFGFFLLKQK